MKILFLNDREFILFLNEFYSSELDLESKENLEKYFRKLFLKIHKYYNIVLTGYYNIHLYHDMNYGVIIKINREDLDYYDYFDNGVDMVDMCILVEKQDGFLYRFEDYLEVEPNILKKGMLYRYQNKFYLRLKEKVRTMELGKVLEFSEIVYENLDTILKQGEVLKIV